MPTNTSNYIRPFGPNAPWNIPVDGLPLHPDSDQLATLLWNDTATNREQRNFNINNVSYTYPVYEVQPTTPYFQVHDRGGWGNLDGTSIPFDPSWQAAPGSDSQIIILDPATGREWDLFQASFDGSTVNVSNGNLVSGYGGSDSYFDREVGFEPSRGAGIPYLAMLVRPEEVAQGHIDHALSMPIRNTSGSAFAAPATKIEFPGVRPDGIPEGTRYALDVTYGEIDQHLASLPSSIPDVTINSLRVLMVAMKDYGWFITDTSGSTHFQLEATVSAEAEWRQLGLIDQSFGGGVYPRDALDGLITEARIVAFAPSDQYASVPTNPVPTPDPSGNPLELFGTPGDDTLVGTSGNDTIWGGDGQDTLNGQDGNDSIFGGSTTADTRDIIYAGPGADYVDAGYGNDIVYGQDGRDTIAGGFGADTLQGQRGADVITGSALSDEIFGNQGNDFLNGGFGHDRVNGGSGADKFFHLGVWDHGTDWIQDYDSAENDVLLFGEDTATASDFQVNFAHTTSDAGIRAGDPSIREAFVIYKPTDQIIWALVDGEGQSHINLGIGADVFDLLA